MEEAHVFQLYWVYDELFVKPEVWEKIFKPFGVGRGDVLLYKKETVLDNVVQLIMDVSEVDFDVRGMGFTDCPQCGRHKYKLDSTRGPLPGFVRDPGKPVVKTKEFVGSGGLASRFIVFSHEVYQVIKENRLNGFLFEPLAEKI